MPINTSLLVSAAILQDLLTDKDGSPMANGTITLYHDLNRSFLKNWYYQTGTPGAYTYVPLPNPLTLSAAGTITDVNGVDTIPFYYPYLESDQTILDPYFIVIQNQAMTNQITRANFPFISGQNAITNTGITFQNLIANNGFWRNLLPNIIGSSNSITLNSILTSQAVQIGGFTTLYMGAVSPSQHDGFTMPDVQFVKDTLTDSTETCTFTPFPLETQQPIQLPTPTNSPEYYISHNSAGSGGESIKCYQFPIALHLNNLTSLNYTVSIQAQNAGAISAASSTIQLRLLQFVGTGQLSSQPLVIAQKSIVLTTSWALYSLTDIFPQTTGLTLGKGSDDGYYLQVWMPANAPCTINFTKPSLYLTTNAIPAFDFQTYDQVNSIISSPRTGDLRVSTNSFNTFGWVPMNDGVIGISKTGSAVPQYYARANNDTFALFSMLWNLAQRYDTGSNFNPICQLYNMTAGLTAINFGASPYADFTANSGNNALQLTRAMGKALIGGVPLGNVIPGQSAQIVSFSNSGGSMLCTVTNVGSFPNQFFYLGQPVIFALNSGMFPAGIAPNTVYYVSLISGNSFLLSTTYANALSYTWIGFAFAVGTYSVFTNFPGASTGEYAHLQNTNEVGTHVHSLNPLTSVAVTGASTAVQTGTGASLTGNNTYPIGGQIPFNVTQPSTYYNIYIKL